MTQQSNPFPSDDVGQLARLLLLGAADYINRSGNNALNDVNNVLGLEAQAHINTTCSVQWALEVAHNILMSQDPLIRYFNWIPIDIISYKRENYEN